MGRAAPVGRSIVVFFLALLDGDLLTTHSVSSKVVDHKQRRNEGVLKDGVGALLLRSNQLAKELVTADAVSR